MKPPAEIVMLASPLAKPNADILAGVTVQRQHERGINSPNEAGGYVPPQRFNSHSK